MESILTGQITQVGVIIDVTVRVTAADERTLLQQKKSPPSPRKVKGLLDTGTGYSWVRESLLTELGLKPTGKGEFGAISDEERSQTTDVYSVGLSLASDLHLDLSVGGAAHMDTSAFDVLIGRDVLSQCRFVYDGIAGRFELGYEAK